MRVIATMALAALVAACSTSPIRPPAAVVASPAGSPSSDAASPGSSSAAATPAGSADAPTTNTVDQALIKRGYKPGLYEGKVFYCKSMLDSEHFRPTRCYTAEQIKAMDLATQGLTNHLLMPGACQGWGCR